MTSENNELVEDLQLEDFSDKLGGVHHYIRYWLNRTQRIFRYEGLPDTIPARNLELILQCKGSAVIAEVEGSLYAFRASLGGKQDVYYQPTLAIVANPAIGKSREFVVDKECVLIRNDSCMTGLLPLFRRYASMLTENECTMRMANINTRVQFLLTAPDDRTRKSAEDFLKKLEDGTLGVIGDNAFLDGVKVQPAGSGAGSNLFTQLIELEQYLRASCWMDIGLSANFNMKREALNTAETSVNDDVLLPFVYDMLEMRKQGVEKVNKMYGTNISVSLDGPWEQRDKELTDETNGEEVKNDDTERPDTGMDD